MIRDGLRIRLGLLQLMPYYSSLFIIFFFNFNEETNFMFLSSYPKGEKGESFYPKKQIYIQSNPIPLAHQIFRPGFIDLGPCV